MHRIVRNTVKNLITRRVKMYIIILNCHVSVKGSFDNSVVLKDMFLLFFLYSPLYPDGNFILLFIQIVIPARRDQEGILGGFDRKIAMLRNNFFKAKEGARP